MNAVDTPLTAPVSPEEIELIGQRALLRAFAVDQYSSAHNFDRCETQTAPPCEVPPSWPVAVISVKKTLLKGVCVAALFAPIPGETTRTEPCLLGQVALPCTTQASSNLDPEMFGPPLHALPASLECGKVSPCIDAVSAVPTGVDAETSRSFALIDLANDVLADSRPMTDWEQKVTDDFFWSQFS